MNTFQKIKPTLYLLFWILLIAAIWFLWLSGLYRLLLIGEYAFVILFGIFVGIVSEFPPKKAYLACFCGFFIIAPFGVFFSIFEDLAFLSIFCGVFGIAGAVIRRIITHQNIEELYLKPWEWVILIGGISLLSDYIVIPCAYAELFIYHQFYTVEKE